MSADSQEGPVFEVLWKQNVSTRFCTRVRAIYDLLPGSKSYFQPGLNIQPEYSTRPLEAGLKLLLLHFILMRMLAQAVMPPRWLLRATSCQERIYNIIIML